MHVLWRYDPRVHADGLWSRRGWISKATQCEIESLENFLSTFLVKRTEHTGHRGLHKSFALDYTRVLVPFDHAESLLNYLETMGHTWEVKGDKNDLR